MASKMSKSYKAEIAGILDIEDNIISILVEDTETPIYLCEFIEDFCDKDVKISISYRQEI